MIDVFYHKKTAKKVALRDKTLSEVDTLCENLDKFPDLWYDKRIFRDTPVERRRTVLGKHSKAAGRLLTRRNIISVLIACVLAAAVGIALLLLSPKADRLETVLAEAGIEWRKFENKNGTVTLTLDGDGEGILACRKALNAWRTSEDCPETLHWILTDGETEFATGTVEQVAYQTREETPRVETLDEEMTVFKLECELEPLDLSVQKITAEQTEHGKALTIVLHAEEAEISATQRPILAAVRAVHEEGGGIAQYTVRYENEGKLLAAASYDLVYGDVLTSSLLQEQ